MKKVKLHMATNQSQSVAEKKQKTKKDNVKVNMGSVCTFVGVWEEHDRQFSLPQAYQLLQKVLEDIIAAKPRSEQKPTVTNHQSLCTSEPAHTWPKIWEPKTSLHIQIPRIKKSSQTNHKHLSLRNNSNSCTKPLTLPPLQQHRQVVTTTRLQQQPFNNIKVVPKRLIKVANLTEINSLPIVSNHLVMFVHMSQILNVYIRRRSVYFLASGNCLLYTINGTICSLQRQ